MSLPRRSLLTGSAAGVGLIVAGAAPSLAEAAPDARRYSGPGTPRQRPFPPLVDDPKGLLALPPGFSYEIVTYAGRTQLDDGQGPTPSNHDGTAVFDAPRHRLRLIQNHELPAGAALGVPHVEGTVYDPTALQGGGCTVIETDRDGRNLGEWVGISGTSTNCAGGPTPWGTWLTCEETETKAGTSWSGSGKTGTYSKDHGYVFEVFADGRALPSRSRPSDATRTRPSPSTRPAPRSTCPRTPATPTASSTAGPLPGASSSRRASPTSSATTTAHSRRWRSSWTTARCCPTSPTSPPHSSVGRSRCAGSACPSATVRPHPYASSSPTRSPAARSSKASSAPTRACTSSTASRSTPRTCRPTPSSTTAWCGSTPTPTRPSPWSPTSRTRPQRRRARLPSTTGSSSTDRTTSPSPRGARSSSPRTASAPRTSSARCRAARRTPSPATSSTSAPRGAGVLGVHRPDLLLGRQGALRQHPDARHHPGHHRSLGEVPGLSPQHVEAPAPRVRTGLRRVPEHSSMADPPSITRRCGSR